MGQSNGEFVKYPSTPHLWNEELRDALAEKRRALGIKKKEDEMIGLNVTRALLSRDDCTYVWESKLDGTNVGISFTGDDQKLFLQNRGHELKAGEHPQYNLFRNWAYTVLMDLQQVLGTRYVMFGEWLNALHTVEYKTLPHYFFEFDIWDKEKLHFFDTESRQIMLSHLVKRNCLQQVPIVHTGMLTYEEALKLMDHQPYFGEEKPEGLYLKVEEGGVTSERYKLVRPDFVQTIIDENEAGEDHWSHKQMVIQGLAPGVDITKPLPEN